jgi:glutaredoxin
MPQWSNAANQPDNVTVYFFHGAECIHCHTVMPFMNATFEKYPNVKFEVLETFHNESNNALFVEMNKKRGIEQYGVPEIFVGDVVLIGSKDIPEKLDGILENITKNKR